MLAYAAANRRPARRAGSLTTLSLILAGHAALIAAVLTARMELGGPTAQAPTVLVDIKDPPPPPPEPSVERQRPAPATQQTFIERMPPIVDMEQSAPFELDRGTTLADIGAVIGSGPTTSIDPPQKDPVKIAARFATPAGSVKPPYPNDRLREQEEATLRLRLTIDPRGRVVAVDPVGKADPSFLEAARRHIMKAWRYKPATEDGVAITTSTVITLSFRLEEV